MLFFVFLEEIEGVIRWNGCCNMKIDILVEKKGIKRLQSK